MKFQDLLSRADDEVLQTLFGPRGVRLLGLIDPKNATTGKLRETIFTIHGAHGLLSSADSRALLFELLRTEEAKTLMAQLQIEGNGNEFEILKKATFPAGSARENSLYGFFELPPPVYEQKSVIQSLNDLHANYPLFPHQRVAVQKILNIYSEDSRALLHMPTGAGKTRTAMNLISHHIRNQESSVVVWLAYSEELCTQAVEEFEEAWPHLGNRKVQVQKFWGRHTFDVNALKDGIVVASLQKLFSSVKKEIAFINALGSKTTFVVIDEAHQAIAPSYKLLLEALLAQKQDAVLLGLTATPGRTWGDIDADQQLANFFRRNKVSLEVEGFNNPVEYLISSGYLARPTFKQLFYGGGLNLSEDDLRQISSDFDFPERILTRLADDEKRNLKIISEIEGLLTRHSRVLVFALSVEHSTLLASVLRARGIDAASVTTQTPPASRTSAIQAYKSDSDRPMVLCNYGVLTTGFDAPKTSAAMIARPTKSLVLYSQMVGRAIRGIEAKGNREAEIVTVIDQGLPGFNSIADAFSNWEDVWTKE